IALGALLVVVAVAGGAVALGARLWPRHGPSSRIETAVAPSPPRAAPESPREPPPPRVAVVLAAPAPPTEGATAAPPPRVEAPAPPATARTTGARRVRPPVAPAARRGDRPPAVVREALRPAPSSASDEDLLERRQ